MISDVCHCTLEHRDLAVDLWARCGLTRPWNDPAADFVAALSSPSSTIVGGFIGPALIASVMVGFDGHRGWAYCVAVDQDHRGRGCGTQMMQMAETWRRDRGAPKLQLLVREENELAFQFYAKLGFTHQPVIIFGRRLDE